MGLLALAAAVGGPLALTAALLHVLGHGLAKSSTFVVSGRILATEGTTTIAGIRSLFARRPGVAIPFVVGMAALLGFPPFSLFFSEVAIVVAGFQGGLGAVMVVAVVLILVLFAGLARHTSSMLFAPVRAGDVLASVPLAGTDAPSSQPDRASHGPRLPLVIALGATAVIAFASGPLSTLLAQAATLLGGTR
jgi:hydrogenase-4 component F